MGSRSIIDAGLCFHQIRIGIGRPQKQEVRDYVLSKFSEKK